MAIRDYSDIFRRDKLKGKFEEVDKVVPAKIYKALISQAGTAAPTVVVFQNTLGFVPAWQRFSIGYYGFENSAIVEDKVFMYLQTQLQNIGRKGQDQIFFDGAGFISVQSTDEAFDVLDDRLDFQSILIEIYD